MSVLPVAVELERPQGKVTDARRPSILVIGMASPSVARGPIWGEIGDPDGRPTAEQPRPAPLAELEVRRITHEDQLAGLPGLSHRGPDGTPWPSLMRDAVELALRNGPGEVEVALLRTQEPVPPWELVPDGRPEVDQIIERYLDRRLGAIVVFPDASGPTPIGTARFGSSNSGVLEPSIEERARRLVRTVKHFSRRLPQRHQICLVDDVADWTRPVDGREPSWHSMLIGTDTALCTWVGSDAEMRMRHGWRCASAAVAGTLARAVPALGTRELPAPHLYRHRVRLGPGRDVPVGRDGVVAAPADGFLHLTAVRLPDGPRPPIVVRDAVLRRPLGSWSLPALWTVKQVVRMIREVAESYVFASVHTGVALEFRTTLELSLLHMIRAGVLHVAEGRPPVVTTAVEGPRNAPLLTATIEATLRPWIVDIRISVALGLDGTTEVTLA